MPEALALVCVWAFLAMAIGVPIATAAQSQVVFDFFGHTGSAAAQFAKGVEEPPNLLFGNGRPGNFEAGPDGIAVNNANGDIYVVDEINNRVQQFDSAHNFIRGWGVDVIPNGASGTGTLNEGSAEVTSVVTTSKAFISGQEVNGAGIPAGTTIREVITGVGAASKLILSAKATAGGTGVSITAAEGSGNLAQNEKQVIGVKASGGSFKLKFKTTMPTAEAETGNIVFNATAAAVQSALEGLGNIGVGNVEVTGPVGGPYTVEFKGKFANTNVAQLTATSTLTGAPVGIFVSTEREGAGRFEKCTLATTCQAGASTGFTGGMNKPQGIAFHQGNGKLYVTDTGNLRVNEYEADGTFVRSWGANVVESGPDNKPEVQSVKVVGTSGTFVLTFGSEANSNTTATGTGTYASGSNEITSVTTSAGVFTVGKQVSGPGIPVGTKITAVEPGKLLLSNNTTEAKSATAISADLPSSAAAGTVETALDALNTIGGVGGSVSVSGGPADATGSNPYTITFGGSLANSDTAQISISASGLGMAENTVLPCVAEPAPTLTYQWLHNGEPIAGATQANYTIQAADAGKALQCQVRAASSEGASIKVSTPAVIASPAPAPAAPTPPSNAPTLKVTTPASGGGFTVGNTISCETGAWTGSGIVFAFQWLRNAEVIGGATSSTYQLQPADNQTGIQCVVTGTNAGGATVGTSSRSVVRSEPPVNNNASQVPIVTGTASVGNSLTCSNGTWTQSPPFAAPTFSYQWLRSGAEIAGATANTYTTVAADAGTAIQCKVVATLSTGAAAAAISNNAVIEPVPNPTPPVRPAAAPSISGTRNVGKILTCSSGAWTPSPAPSLSFRWLRNGAAIAGATSSTYTVVAADLDKQLQCQVTATNGTGASTDASASAATTATVVGPPSATSSVTTPTVASTTVDGGLAEICETGDVCRAGVQTESSSKQFGGTFASTQSINNQLAIAPGGPYAGDVFVGDGGNHRIQIFNPGSGAFVAAFGREVLQSGPETSGLNVCIAALGDICRAGNSSPTAPNAYGFHNPSSQEVHLPAPAAIAIDNTGAIYAPGGGGAFLQKYSPDLTSEHDFAPEICTPANGFVEGCYQVAVDPDTNDVYVVHAVRGESEVCLGSLCIISPFTKEYVMVRFDSTGTNAPIERMLDESGIQHINGIAVDGSTGNQRSGRVYFTTSTPEQRVDVLGFATPPDIEFEPIEAADIGPHSVTVRGSINPNGNSIDTSYLFETNTEGGGSWSPYPATPVDVGKGTSPVAVEATIPGLRANSKYKVRLVAIKGQRTIGPEQHFTTQPEGPTVQTGTAAWSGPPSSNPSLTFSGTVDDNNLPVHYFFEYGADSSYGNRVPVFETGTHPAAQAPFLARGTVDGLDPSAAHHFRIVAHTSSGTSFGADHEIGPAQSDIAYPELVSPRDKGVGIVGKGLVGFISQEDNQAAANGDRLAYMFEYGLPDGTAGGEILALAQRGQPGWTSLQMTPPSTVPPLVNDNFPVQGMQGSVRWMSPDIGCWFFQSRGKVTPETPELDVENLVEHLYVGDIGGNYRMITPSPLNTLTEARVGFGNHFKVRGASPDCRRVIFSTGFRLLPGIPAQPAQHVYEWEDTGGSGTLRLVDVLPDGVVPPVGAGSIAVSTERHAVSQPDASRSFFVATSDAGGDKGKPAVFVRKNHSVTIDASQSQTGVGNTGTTTYETASADGSHVFFTAIAGLASNSATTTGNSVYDYDVDTGVLRDLAHDANPADTAGAAIDGVMATNNDGSYVYFGAQGQLVAGQGNTYAQNVSTKQDNVYVAHGGSLSYVAKITQSDLSKSPVFGAQVTNDGRFLVFNSSLDLTPYESKGVRQLYRYSVQGPSLDCVSCLPGGPSANGKDIVGISAESNQVADIYPNRIMSADGAKIFFNVSKTIEENGGQRTVARPYEWHGGQTRALAGEGIFVDASADSEDVFILTSEPLVPQDQDSAPDMYDLRVNGGFSYFPPEPCDPLTENSCQGTPPTPPVPAGDPASSTFSGPGNPPEGAPTRPKHHKHHKKKHKKRHKQRQRSSERTSGASG